MPDHIIQAGTVPVAPPSRHPDESEDRRGWQYPHGDTLSEGEKGATSFNGMKSTVVGNDERLGRYLE